MPVSPPVRAIEAWLQDLAAAPFEDDAAHTLFILDNDFGELTTVMYWVLGQPGFHKARVLVSQRLYDTNADVLPGRLSLWRSEQDLVEAIHRHRPRLIVLASGYLMPVHGLLSPEALQRILLVAGAQGATTITADPFMGVITRPPGQPIEELISIQIPENAPAPLRAAKKLGDDMLRTRLGGAEAVLRDLPHLYPSHTDMSDLQARSHDDRNLSFFNAALRAPAELLEAARRGEPSYWMFLIAQADHQTQCMFMGASAFARVVADRLEDATRLGRRAILLGPSELLSDVRLLVGGNRDIELLPFCAFSRAMALLLAAEYCFYWNLVSHSIIMQLWNGRPIILFDQGHLVRAAPTIRERIIAWYYQGWDPPQIDQTEPLSLERLATALDGYADRREGLMARYGRAPSSEALLNHLLAGRRPAA